MKDIFNFKPFTFPKNFFWGSATAGHQIEGDNLNADRYYNEQRLLLENPNYEVSGKACNSYEMYKEDAKIVKELGHQVYRLSLEWSRIEPKNGEFSKKEVDHYVDNLKVLKEQGTKVCLTYVHFTIPKWFEDLGGFKTLDNMSIWLRFVEYITPIVAPYCDYVCIFNEFNLLTDAKYNLFKFNSVIYHAKAYHVIKKHTQIPVSTAHAFVLQHPVRNGDKFDTAVANYNDVIHNEFFFHAIRTGEVVMPGVGSYKSDEIKNTCDFWSINIYVRSMVDARKPNLEGDRYEFSRANLINTKFYLDEFDPENLVHNLTRLMDKPVIISENGCACDNDDLRIVFLTEYLCALNECIKLGVNVIGYLHWSLLDNYEWSSFTPKFGLVKVDRENGFKRTPKKSAYYYKEIIENNGFSQEILRKYLDKMPSLEYQL